MNKNQVPKASPEPLAELTTFLEPFAPLFRRHTSRDSMERYLTGLLTDLPHKTCDTIADVIAGTSVERLQHLMTDAAWDPHSLDEARVKSVLRPASRDRWHPGVRRHWPTEERERLRGVAPQYSGTLGQNWQLPGGGECRISCRQSSQRDSVPLASERPTVFARVLGSKYRAAQASAGASGDLPANEATDRPGIARSSPAMGACRSRPWWLMRVMETIPSSAGTDERQVPYMCAVQSTFGCRLPDEVQAAVAQTPVYGGRGQPRKPRPAPLYTVKRSSAPCLPLPGKPSVGAREPRARCRSRPWLCASTGPLAPLCTAPATVSSIQDRRGGCSPNGPYQKP